ncbi:MAG: ATP synthase F1 subunit delta [bacterium]
MEASQVAKRYARGLFAVTEEQQSSAAVNGDFADLAEYCRQDPALLQFLAAPQIGDADKDRVVKEAFSGKIAESLFHMLELLVTKRRTSFLVEIAEEYEQLFLASKGVVKTTLVTAIALSPEELDNVRAKLAGLTGKTIEIVTEVDESIIGGAIAYVGDKIIDRSIRYGLQQLRDRLLELKVS